MNSYNTDCKIFREFKGELNIDGINIYNPEVVQFRLYKDPSSLDDDLYYVFPMTAGMVLFGDFYVLNEKDCVAVVTDSDIVGMFSGDFSRSLNDSIYN